MTSLRPSDPASVGLTHRRFAAVRRRHALVRARGFTVVELLMAATAGLAISVAVFALSKNSMDLFQHEARISAAHLAATLGMNRLTADIARAGYMASPNIAADPRVCGTPPAELNTPGTFVLQGLFIDQDGSTAAAPQSAANGLDPDAVEIVGNFASSEQFPVASIDATGATPVITLQMNSGAMVRSITRAGQGGGDITEIFRAQRLVRLIDSDGRHSYGEVGLITAPGAPNPTSVTITLSGNIAMPSRVVERNCGFSGFATGALINPIARVRYDLRNLPSDPNYAADYKADYEAIVDSPALPANAKIMSGDAARTELFREELDYSGAAVADTLELIAEYAVDLEFGATIACGTSPASTPTCNTTIPEGTEPSLLRIPIPDASANISAHSPQRIQAVQVRLSTRSRAPDRKQPLLRNDQTPVAGSGRFYIPNIPGDPGAFGDLNDTMNYARMRTLVTDVTLVNQAGVRW